MPSERRRYLDVRFDVTGLTDKQIERLMLYVAVQAEGGSEEGYPDVPEPTMRLADGEAPSDPAR
jgi:hypothetical protein